MSIPARDRRLQTVRSLLRLVLLVQAIGLGAQYLFGEFEADSDVYTWLYIDYTFADDATEADRLEREQFAQRVDDAGHWAYLGSAVLLLVVPLTARLAGMLRKRPWRGISSMIWQAPLLLYMTAWLALIAALHMMHDGEQFAQLAVGEQAVRILAPLGLLMLLPRPGRAALSPARVADALSLLRWAAAATFLVHGLKALLLDGQYVVLILHSATNLLGDRITLEQADTTLPLRVIGAIDLALALLLVTTRFRLVALYMAFWGLATAASRMTATGLGPYADPLSLREYGQFLIRAANAGVPLAIFVFWHMTHRIRKNSRPRGAPP